MKTEKINTGVVPGILPEFHLSLLEHIDECLLLVNSDFRIFYANETFRSRTNLHRSFYEGKELKLFDLTGRPMDTGMLEQVLDKNKFWQGEIKLPEGSVSGSAFLKLVLTDIPGDRGRLIMCVFKFRDGDFHNRAGTDSYKLMQLLNDIIIKANKSDDIFSTLQYTIDRICGFTEWEIGHCFLVISKSLISTKIWNSDFDSNYDIIREFTDRVNFRTKESMASVCLESGRHLRMKLHGIDIRRYRRIGILQNLGFATGYWIPVKIKDEITGVLEFFSRNDELCEQAMFEGINNISYELGSMIERIRTADSKKNKDKLAALGRFSAGIAHEIRNPLANISALSQLLLKQDLNERSEQHLKYIIENTEIANRIITDLLNYASGEDMIFEKINFRKFILGICSMAEIRCSGRKIRFSRNIARDIPDICIDKLKLENALMNIISNAIDSMPEGGNLSFEAFTSKSGDNIRFIIEDTGCGIAQENIDKIYEPFFSTKNTGTGLGLSLTLQTISLHGGSLSIKSKQGKGTAVEIQLPAERKEHV